MKPVQVSNTIYLLLDGSQSTHEAQVWADMLESAQIITSEPLENQTNNSSRVGIILFGQPGEVDLMLPPTDDSRLITDALDTLQALSDGGSRDVLNDTLEALIHTSSENDFRGAQETSIIMLVSGRHQTGGAQRLNEKAHKVASEVNAELYTLTFGQADTDQITGAFLSRRIESDVDLDLFLDDANARIANRLASHTVIGVCTPTSGTTSSFTVLIEHEGQTMNGSGAAQRGITQRRFEVM